MYSWFIHQPLDAFDDREGMEVDEKSQFQTRQAKIGEQLGTMDLGRGIDRLQLHDDRVFDHKISAIADAHAATLVLGFNRNLTLESEASVRQFERERRCISTFEQPDSEHALHFHRTPDDRVRAIIFGWPFLLRPLR